MNLPGFQVPFMKSSVAASDEPSSPGLGAMTRALLWLLVLVPIVFNAITLLTEVSLPVPSLNDDAVHYLLIQRASEALARSENLFDHWLPEFELGFPMFFYYQHLPHLFVIALHRVLLQKFDLLAVFNAVRYLLLVGFPLTVYWSMRRLEFSPVAAAVGAASASLISSNHRYGFEYESYIWRGHGMFTQLWAMHFSFIVLANLHRLLDQGRGYVATTISCSALLLSHLIYTYMMAITGLVLVLNLASRANWRALLVRLAVLGGFTAVICSYMWLPFLSQIAFFGASPYLQRWKYDSFGAGDILWWLVNGDLLDYGRWPVTTVILALGIAAALMQFRRNRPARIFLSLFVVWVALYFGRPTWGHFLDVFPLHDSLLFHRFKGSIDIMAILLIGMGGEWLWRQASVLGERWRAAVVAAAVLFLLVPALRERQNFYSFNTQWIERTRKALAADEDANAIITTLKELPPGRAHAGLRANWGKALVFGDLKFSDLLTFHRLMPASAPYSSMSLNADLLWHFDDRNPAHYNLFNIKYLIAPRTLPVASFLRSIKETRRYTLYRAETDGYASYVTINGRRTPSSQANLFFQNRDWIQSAEPAAGRFIRYDFPAKRGANAAEATKSAPAAEPPCPGGKISEESVLPGRIDLQTDCTTGSAMILKTTYHPNWHVDVDGHDVPTFMVSPSFIGFHLPAGTHRVQAEYRAGILKTILLLVGACALLVLFCSRRWLARFDERLCAVYVTSKRR
jgi:hypothetical protein